MKTRARIPAKVVSKPPQKPIQTTLERHSISRDVSENLKTKTGESNSKLSSFNLNAIALSSKKTATISPNISDRNIQSQFKTIQPPKNAGVNTIRPKQQHPVIENISSSPQQIQQISGSLGKIGGAISSGAKNLGGAISSGAKNLVGGVTDFFTEQFNSGKGDAERILKNAEREANRVIQAGEAEAKKIMGDTSVSTSQSRTGGGFLSKIKTAIRSLKVPRIFAKLENNAITPTGGSLIQGFFGKISKAIKRAVSRASKGKITFNSGGRYNARGRAKAVAERAKSKARRVAALARLRAKRFLRHRESIAKYLVNSAKTRAKRINQDAKSRSQRMMQRGEYTAAKSLLYKEKRRARLLVYRNNRYARTILNKAQPIANRIIAKGKIRAERIIAWGERKADRIIQDGQRRADNVIRQAQQRAERIREQGKRDADAAIRRRKKNVFQKLAGWIGDGIRGLANAVGNFIKAAGNFLGKIARGAVDFLKAVGRGIQSLGNALINGAKRAWNAAKQVLKKAAEVVVAIVKEAVKVVKEIAQTIIDVIAAPFKVLYQLIQLMRQIGGKVASVAGKIAKNPLKFGETLINGGKAGFNRFTSQFPQHLENGIQGYLFGETNIKLPSFDAKGIITMLLQTVGLSRDSVREMAVAKLGEEKVAFAEGFSEAASEGKMGELAQEQAQTYASNVANQVGNQTQLPLLAKLFTALSKGGQGIINFFKELNLSELIKTIVIDGIKNFLIETIQNKAIPYAMAKLAASATPIVGWIMAAIDGLKMANEIFVKRAQQVKALVDSLGDAVVNAASYAEGGVASQLEAGMKKAIPILMSALASYANIGDIPSKIKGVIDKGKNWVNENIKPYINKVIDTVGSLIPDLSGKQLATRITKGLGIGNVYDRIRNYLKPYTQKPFETFNDAKNVVDTAQTVFKPLGINSLNLEQADKTGHSFNVIAAKPLPGRKPVINANPIRISRKPSIVNSRLKIEQRARNVLSLKRSRLMVNQRAPNVLRLPRSHNPSLKTHHQFKQNPIPLIQRKSVSLTPQKITSRLQTTNIRPKYNISSLLQQQSPLVSTVSQRLMLQKSEDKKNSENNNNVATFEVASNSTQTLSEEDRKFIRQIENEVAQINEELALELTKVALDIAGVVDPTPTADSLSAAISIKQREYFDAGLSLLSWIPYVGDAVAKPIKATRSWQKLEKILTRIKSLIAKHGDRLQELKGAAVEKLVNYLKGLKNKIDDSLERLGQKKSSDSKKPDPGSKKTDSEKGEKDTSDSFDREKYPNDLSADIIKKISPPLTPEEISEYIEALGIAKVKELAEKFGGDVMKHYGHTFFKSYKGATQDTINHLLKNDGIKKGAIKGCHDADTFLDELVTSGIGNIRQATPHPSNSQIIRYEYSLYQKNPDGSFVKPKTLKDKPLVKTVMKDLKSNQNYWQELANKAAEDAIKRKEFPISEGKFIGNTPDGISIEGWYRNNSIDTFYPIF